MTAKSKEFIKEGLRIAAMTVLGLILFLSMGYFAVNLGNDIKKRERKEGLEAMKLELEVERLKKDVYSPYTQKETP